MNRYFASIFVSLITLSSCHFIDGKHIRGNGAIKKDDRTGNATFNSVDVSNAFELHIRQDSSRSINIEADENLLQYVIIENDGDKLRISTEHGYNLDPSNGNRVKIFVSSPVFKDIEASGASTIIGDNPISSDGSLGIDVSGASDAALEIRSPKVSVEMTGASSVNLKGQTRDLAIEGSGASHARCFDILAENVDVDVSGASSAEVFASVRINATASGASNVKTKGKGTLTKNESGASNVDKVD